MAYRAKPVFFAMWPSVTPWGGPTSFGRSDPRTKEAWIASGFVWSERVMAGGHGAVLERVGATTPFYPPVLCRSPWYYVARLF